MRVECCCVQDKIFLQKILFFNLFELNSHNRNGTEIAKQTLKGDLPEQLFDVVYTIPYNLTKGKEKIEVKFVSTEGKIAGGVYGVKILNAKPN